MEWVGRLVKKVVLDACVLYPASIRDTLLSVAAEGCFIPFWSQLIHNEWQRNLLKNRDDLTQENLNYTSDAMDRSFHGSCFNDFHQLLDQMNLPDKDDNHVLALAVACGAEYIVTSNLKDFPENELAKYNVKTITPDQFLVKLFNQLDILVIEGLKAQRSRLKNPIKSEDEFVETLKNSGLIEFSNLLEEIKNEL